MMRHERRYRGTPLAVQADHAAQLSPGTRVIVRDDVGRDHRSVVLGRPFLLGGHTYVVNCEGFHAYSVMRVRLDLEAQAEAVRLQPESLSDLGIYSTGAGEEAVCR